MTQFLTPQMNSLPLHLKQLLRQANIHEHKDEVSVETKLKERATQQLTSYLRVALARLQQPSHEHNTSNEQVQKLLQFIHDKTSR